MNDISVIPAGQGIHHLYIEKVSANIHLN